jgi:hypothetical protein
MARRGIVQILLATALAGIAGCTLAVDVSDIDRGCGAGKKLCGTGHCVAQDDPAYGCTLDHCEPCALTNAIPACAGETCVVSACLFGFDCPNEVGCPVNILVEQDNCGACGVSCSVGRSCRDGQCLAN